MCLCFLKATDVLADQRRRSSGSSVEEVKTQGSKSSLNSSGSGRSAPNTTNGDLTKNSGKELKDVSIILDSFFQIVVPIA